MKTDTTNANNVTAEFYLNHPKEFFLHLGRGMKPPIAELDETQFLEILDQEFHKYGTAFLNTKKIQKIFKCSKQDANICIKFYIDYYELTLTNDNVILTDETATAKTKKTYTKNIFSKENLALVADAYNHQAEYVLKANKIATMLNCSTTSARKFIHYFCELFKIPNPIKNFQKYLNDKKFLAKLDKYYEKKGAAFFTTQNIMQKLKCGRVTANKIVKMYSEKYNFEYEPMNIKKYNEEYIVGIYQEYLDKGIFALNVENIKKKLLIKKDCTARRYIRKFCNLYYIGCPLL